MTLVLQHFAFIECKAKVNECGRPTVLGNGGDGVTTALVEILLYPEDERKDEFIT